MTDELLSILDDERRASGVPSSSGTVVREFAPDGAECRIVHSNCTADNVDAVIRDEIARAQTAGYTLEWKTYGHDTPPDLGDRLLAAGFEADDRESVLALPLTETSIAAFETQPYEVRRVHDDEGLAGVAEISREIGRTDVEAERHRLAAVLRDSPRDMSVHVAYVDGKPVSTGRIYFPEGSNVAELAGGRTKSTHRNRGLFTALVASRLREAVGRDRTYAFVDALPTSEPILRKRGFRFVTDTRPFVYTPRG